MASVTAKTFIDALWHLEGTGEAGPIAGLFTPGATVSNPLVKHAGQEPDGAMKFWQAYRSAFGQIRSEFKQVLEGEGSAMLEWSSRGDVGGAELEYGGVSVLEIGDDGIMAFRTYFDPQRLGEQLAAQARTST